MTKGGGGSGGSGGTGGSKRGRGAKEVVEDEDGNKYPVVAVPWNNLGLFCGLNTGSSIGCTVLHGFHFSMEHGAHM